MIELSVIAPPLGVVTAAGISAFAVIRSRRSDVNASHTAAIETQSGMAGLVIAGWQNLMEEGRIREAEGRAREAQLRVDLDACLARARARARRRASETQ